MKKDKLNRRLSLRPDELILKEKNILISPQKKEILEHNKQVLSKNLSRRPSIKEVESTGLIVSFDKAKEHALNQSKRRESLKDFIVSRPKLESLGPPIIGSILE